MNERIKELAEEANAYAIACGTTTGDDFEDAFDKKFGELIVKECASIAGKAEYSDTWTEPVEDTIKKHFGVEE